MDMVIASGSLGGIMVSVLVSTDLLDKEPHSQVAGRRVIASGSVGGVMVTAVVCTDFSDR